MERLTVRNSEGIGVLKQPFECERCGDFQWSLPDLGNGSPTDRLAEYEDLEEQCIRDNTWGLRILLTKWKELFRDIQELYEYRKLEKQGKLLKLPCAVGDAYYRIENDGVNPPRVREWKVRTLEFCVTVRDCIGKTVFLTREEAEAALKELHGTGE